MATSVRSLQELFDSFDDVASTTQVRPEFPVDEKQQQADKRDYYNVFQD
jgi:hypothetical protein